MKVEPRQFLRRFWRFLTIVPGWPDAGRLARTLYALPLVVPFSALLLLWAGDMLVRRPAIGAARAACAPGVALEAEVDSLAFACSDAQAAEVAASVAELETGLLGDAALQAFMDRIRAAATAGGWSATLVANDSSLPAGGSSQELGFRTIRGRIVPKSDRGDFRVLLALIEDLVPPEVRGGVSRVAIRGDEQGRLAVELGVRVAVVPPDEKTP